MTVTFEVTEAQALALQAMFEYWTEIAVLGASREVAFFVDGDGNFKPNCQFAFSRKVRELTKNLRKYAVVKDSSGDRVYDFDHIAWSIFHGRNEYTGESLPTEEKPF